MIVLGSTGRERRCNAICISLNIESSGPPERLYRCEIHLLSDDNYYYSSTIMLENEINCGHDNPSNFK